MKKVRVIGAGMNGLLMAYYLVENGCQVEVFEKTDRVGGLIQTHTSENGKMEAAANAILADAEVESVAGKIGLKLEQSRRGARWIFRDGRRRWPLGLAATRKVIQFFYKKSFDPEQVKPKAGETLRKWADRTVGAEACTYLLEPACSGIFAAGADDLSATLIYDYFFGARKKVKGRLRGSIRADGGMGNFPGKLREYLETRGVVFHFGVAHHQPGGETVVATGLTSAAEILQSWQDPRGVKLAQVPTIDLVSVNAFYRFHGGAAKGFGVLFPRRGSAGPLGVLFNTFIFWNGEQCYSNTWIFGGRSPQAIVSSPDEEILGQVQRTREDVLKMPSELLESRINRWPRALPLYGLELEKTLADLPVSHSGVHLAGNYLGEIGLNRFFHRAKALAKKIATT